MKLSPLRQEAASHLRWWLGYSLLQVGIHVALSSVAAFFHFLLGHGISLVEGWLHNNGWELALVSKGLALLIIHRLLRVRFYLPLSLTTLTKERVRLPRQRTLVICVFLLAAVFILSGPRLVPENGTYWGHHITAFLGMAFWLGCDVLMGAVMHDLFPFYGKGEKRLRTAFYVGTFLMAYRLIVPDYFGALIVVGLHFITLIVVCGENFEHWSDGVLYTGLVAAPLAMLLGMDPLWGPDFAPFKAVHPLTTPSLIAIWVLSWAYHSNRHRWRWLPRSS